jgi:hypothetical protein
MLVTLFRSSLFFLPFSFFLHGDGNGRKERRKKNENGKLLASLNHAGNTFSFFTFLSSFFVLSPRGRKRQERTKKEKRKWKIAGQPESCW